MLGNSRQQTNTEIIMDTQTEVKLFVQKAVLNIAMTINFNAKVLKIIQEGLREVDNKDLKERATRVLQRYAQQEYQKQMQMLGIGLVPLMLSFYKKSQLLDVDVRAMQKAVTQTIRKLPVRDVHKAYTNLGNSQAKVSYSQSLYGNAELQARYDERVDELANLKKTTRLVICDTHSDCSDRCSRWQGGIYSLDGTYGRTSDGRSYRPLEDAVNDTKYGLNNGLLGYNCRHKLYPYKEGMRAVRVNEKERKREYAITVRQRRLERDIRGLKDKTLSYKNAKDSPQFDNFQRQYIKGLYDKYKARTKERIAEYRQFCEKYSRTEYRSRIKI